jgi:hypothetical protein
MNFKSFALAAYQDAGTRQMLQCCYLQNSWNEEENVYYMFRNYLMDIYSPMIGKIHKGGIKKVRGRFRNFCRINGDED